MDRPKVAPPLLNPIDRYAELLFGLFMVLTFTGGLSVATAGQQDVHSMMLAALGCNTAWGFVDAVMYLLRTVVARGQRADLLRRVHAAAPSSPLALSLIAEQMRPDAGELGPAQLAAIEQWMRKQPTPPRRARLEGDDLRGAARIFCLVFGSTLPVVMPYGFTEDLGLAHRLSSAIAIAMMFGCGYAWGRYAGGWPLRAGLLMVAAGSVIVAVVMALGG